ncbi:hypothetical protein KSP40_PGU000236 [Platanthera guangdongensis]|uniref:Uncharacterized protein n=1 Tax=Platanthera guangdongensis TaxID=2320717 RepID=A0ABR2M0U5_9ASPA
MLRRRRNALRGTVKSSDSTENAAPRDAELDKDDQRVGPNLETLFRRFWKVAAPYWSSEDKIQVRLRLGAVFALTLATTGISVGFNFLGRDFYNSLANKDQEQFTKQLFYYLGAFAGGIPVSIFLYPCRRKQMTKLATSLGLEDKMSAAWSTPTDPLFFPTWSSTPRPPRLPAASSAWSEARPGARLGLEQGSA